ncbi:MAG: 2-oxoacid:acceptor oxidoreductase subunit alpha [Candidatus Omnitrophota bacterium]
MRSELMIRVTGEAGQGLKTIGNLLCKIFRRSGWNLFANQDYMSRIRGGNNFFQIRVSNKPVCCTREKCDLIVALDKDSVGIHRKDLNESGRMIADLQKFGIENDPQYIDIPLFDIAQKIGGNDIYINSVACGMISALAGVNFASVKKELEMTFARKGADIIEKNIHAAFSGYEKVNSQAKDCGFVLKEDPEKTGMLIDGNDAIGISAIVSGCKFYSGYPMTPSTGIMEFIARYADRFNIVVEQAEDEIAAVNMVIGASYAGVRSMTSTSGGGFALMTEALSLAGMTETPIVIVDAQRPGPATGFPTRTEQADIDFLINAGHGEFARAVLSPGTIEEAFYLTNKAFYLADKYQIPVLLMTDQHLADSYRNVDLFDISRINNEHFIISKEASVHVNNYKRYALTQTGISPRAIPSWIADVIYADSDEHTEEGHITEDADVRIQMVQKRFYKKMEGLQQEVEEPVAYKVDDADMILIGYGSTFGAINEVCRSETNLGFIHLPQVWPFPASRFQQLIKKGKKLLTVEGNAGGKLAKLIKMETCIEVNGSILRYDGRPINRDYLLSKLAEELKHGSSNLSK